MVGVGYRPHLDRDRKNVRAYLRGERRPRIRAGVRPDPLGPFVPYPAAQVADDPHLWASALYDEVVPLGYGLSYVSFVPQLRLAGLRPHCEACAGYPAGRRSRFLTRPVRRSSGTGSSGGTRRGAAAPMCCWGSCRTPTGSARCWRSPWTSRTDRGDGRRAAPVWRHPRVWRTDRLSTVIVPGTHDVQPASPRWRSITGWWSSRARCGAATARARWSPRCGMCAADGGGP
jgi:hypothetical protein